MYLTEEESKRRLEHPDGEAARKARESVEVKHQVVNKGGRRGPQIPFEVKKLMGVAANFGTIKEVAKQFGVTPSTVQGAKHGFQGPQGSGRKSPELTEAVENGVDKVKDRALLALMGALNVITPDKLRELSPTAAAIVADKMSVIVDRANPKSILSNNVQVVVYAPREKTEAEYESVTVTGRIVE